MGIAKEIKAGSSHIVQFIVVLGAGWHNLGCYVFGKHRLWLFLYEMIGTNGVGHSIDFPKMYTLPYSIDHYPYMWDL